MEERQIFKHLFSIQYELQNFRLKNKFKVETTELFPVLMIVLLALPLG